VTLVRAAGGVITREDPNGTEVVLVHRPRYDDWSFPKGKLDPGETELEAALREVEEETGLTARPGADLGVISYVDSHGRPKVVRYWQMRPPPGAEVRGMSEVDDARWVPLDEARTTLSYPHDRRLLRRLAGEPPADEPVSIYVIRHTEAGDRDKWREPDELRPTSKTGRKQALKLWASLKDVPFTRLVSSPFIRCIQTLEPFSDALGIDITIARELAEGEPVAGAEAWALAAAADGPAALSTHGDIVQGLVQTLRARGVPVVDGDGEAASPKGSVWRLDVVDGKVRELAYVPPPVQPPGNDRAS
jgi:8-oxo-dGTP pyrophosphatase MutT (NUDIX family)